MDDKNAEVIRLHAERSTEADNAEWRQTVTMLSEAVRARDPDGLARVNYFIRRMEQELGPLVSSLAVMQARQRTQEQGSDDTKEITMQGRIVLLQGRISDLRHIQARARSAPRDSHDGPTAEARVKGTDASILVLPDGLKSSAEDLRCGWMVRSPSEQHAKAVKLELEAKGYGDYGRMAEMLEHQYLDWLKEMQRQKVCIWPVDDVVCRGRSYTEAAVLRRSDVAVVSHLVLAGLTIYHILFPPIDTTRKAGI